MHDPGPDEKNTNLSVQGVGDWAVVSREDAELIEESTAKKDLGEPPEDFMFSWVINNEMSQINKDSVPPKDAVPSLTQQDTASTRSGAMGLGIHVPTQGISVLLDSSSGSTVSQETCDLKAPDMALKIPSSTPIPDLTVGYKNVQSPTVSADSSACDSDESAGLSQMSSPSTAATTESLAQIESPGGWNTDETISTASPHAEEFYTSTDAPIPHPSTGPSNLIHSPIMMPSPTPTHSSAGTDSSEEEPGTKDVTTQPRKESSEKVSSNGEKKRPRDEKSEPNDKDPNNHNPGTRTKKAKIDDQQTPLLACPFYKKDPIRHRGCFGYVIKRIAYVRQHLFRNHLQPSHCVVCMSILNTEEELSEHLRAQSCQRRPQSEQPDGITPKQQKELRNMRANHRKSEKDQWYDIFSMLFPGVELPSSPYINQGLSEDMSSFREFMERKGGAIVEETLKTNLPSFGIDEPKFREQAQAAVLRIFTEWVDQFGTKSQDRVGDPATGSDDTKGGEFVNWTPKGQKKKERVDKSQNITDAKNSGAVNDKKGNRASSDVIREIIDVEGKRGNEEVGEREARNDGTEAKQDPR